MTSFPKPPIPTRQPWAEKLQQGESISREMKRNAIKHRKKMKALTSTRKATKSLVEAPEKIQGVFNIFLQSINASEHDILGALSKLEMFENELLLFQNGLSLVSTQMKVKADETLALKELLSRLTGERDASLEKYDVFKHSLPERISSAVAPLQSELTNIKSLLTEEREEKKRSYQLLAELWPRDWSMPTVLLPFKNNNREGHLSPTDDYQHRNKAKDQGGDMFYERMWMIQYDDQGRQYYENSYTGETSWDLSVGSKLRESWDNGGHEMNEQLQRSESVSKGGIVSTSIFAPHHNISKAARSVIMYIKNWNKRNTSGESDMPYGMQTIEELAAGADGWSFPEDFQDIEQVDNITNDNPVREQILGEVNDETETTTNLRKQIYELSKREEETEESLAQIRNKLMLLSHRLNPLTESDAMFDIKQKGIISSNIKDTFEAKNPQKQAAPEQSLPKEEHNSTRLSTQSALPVDMIYVKVVHQLASCAIWSGFSGEELHSSDELRSTCDENTQQCAAVFLKVNCTANFKNPSHDTLCNRQSGGRDITEQSKEFCCFVDNLHLPLNTIGNQATQTYDTVVGCLSKRNYGQKSDSTGRRDGSDASFGDDEIALHNISPFSATPQRKEDNPGCHRALLELDFIAVKHLLDRNDEEVMKSDLSFTVDDGQSHHYLETCMHNTPSCSAKLQEETAAHDKLLNQLTKKAYYRRHIILSDCLETTHIWRGFVKECEESINTFFTEIQSLEAGISDTKEDIDRLSVQPIRPLPPQVRCVSIINHTRIYYFHTVL